MTGRAWADSTGRRNTGFILTSKELVEDFGGSFSTEGLSRPRVQRMGHGIQFLSGVFAEVGTFGEVLPEQAIGVFVRAPLPRALWVAKVDFQSAIDTQ